MKLLIVFAGVIDAPSEWPTNKSLALQRLAGNNVLGHILNQLKDIHPTELLLLVDRDEDLITAWLQSGAPELAAKVVPVPPDTGPWQALAQCRRFLDADQWLLAFGSYITEADFKNLVHSEAPVTIFVPPDLPGHAQVGDVTRAVSPWAGLCHFRQGTDLQTALASHRHDDAFPLFLDHLRDRDLHVVEQPATMCLDTATIDGFFFANARLLGLGYGSEDAIERSYVEDFTIVPPVFLHETAVIENAVIGPFANIEAGATIRSSVIRDTLVGIASAVENAVLDRSFIGDHAHVQAAGKSLIIKDGETEIVRN